MMWLRATTKVSPCHKPVGSLPSLSALRSVSKLHEGAWLPNLQEGSSASPNRDEAFRQLGLLAP